MSDPVGALVQLWNKQRQDKADMEAGDRATEASFVTGLNALNNTNKQYGNLVDLGKKRQFGQELAEITKPGQDPQTQIQGIMKLGAKYGGFMGMDEQIKMYVDGISKFGTTVKDEKKQQRQNLVDSTKIREEFLNRPEVKDYVNINTQVRSMDSLLEKAKSGNIKNKVALDQGLITMYNKLTDPTSVVRESEYARTPENLPLINRFQGAMQKIEKGGAGLTDADRDALVWGAKVIANERGRTYNETLQGYTDLSNQYEIDTPLITRGLKAHQNYEFGDVGNVPSNNVDLQITPKGNKFKFL